MTRKSTTYTTRYVNETPVERVTLRGDWHRLATILGLVSCFVIGSAFLVPWYRGDFDHYTLEEYDFQLEYYPRIWMEYYPSNGYYSMGELMSDVAIVLVHALGASIIATISSHLRMRLLGLAAAAVCSCLFLASAIIFYYGVMMVFSLNSFEGYVHINRSVTATTEAMIGWWIALTGAIVPGAQATILALSQTPKHEDSSSFNEGELVGTDGGKT